MQNGIFDYRAKCRGLCVLVVFVLLTGGVLNAAPKRATDVYVVYTMKNKQVKKILKGLMPGSIKTKFYNADLLTVADYSGKQKAVSKFERSRLVVFVGDAPIKLLEGSELKVPVLIINSALQGVSSSRVVTYLMDGKHASSAPSGLKKFTLASAAEFKATETGGKNTVLIIDKSETEFWQEVPTILQQLLAQ